MSIKVRLAVLAEAHKKDALYALRTVKADISRHKHGCLCNLFCSNRWRSYMRDRTLQEVLLWSSFKRELLSNESATLLVKTNGILDRYKNFRFARDVGFLEAIFTAPELLDKLRRCEDTVLLARQLRDELANQ